MDNIDVGGPANAQTGAGLRERQPWQPPELTKETVQEATGLGKALNLIELLVLGRVS